MENEVKPGDVYALDDGSFVVVAEEGCMSVDKTGVYVHKAAVDCAYLHSMRAVSVGNLKEALCQLSL